MAWFMEPGSLFSCLYKKILSRCGDPYSDDGCSGMVFFLKHVVLALPMVGNFMFFAR